MTIKKYQKIGRMTETLLCTSIVVIVMAENITSRLRRSAPNKRRERVKRKRERKVRGVG